MNIRKTKRLVSNKRRKIIPMRNVYADAIRCYVAYLMVLLMISIAPCSVLISEAFSEDSVQNDKETITEEIIYENESNYSTNLTAGISLEMEKLLEDIDTKTVVSENNNSYLVASPLITSTSALEKEENKIEKTIEKEEITYTEVILEETDEEETIKEEYIENEEKEEEIIDYYHDTYTSDSSVKNSSGLTAEQIDKLLEGTELYGIGQAVFDIEQEYSIDAYFTISVSSLESGYGSSDLAHSKNNIFGMIGCSFKSYNSCVMYFGKLMYSYEYEHDITMTPNGINPRYCELDSWAGKVTSLMNRYVEKANKLF